MPFPYRFSMAIESMLDKIEMNQSFYSQNFVNFQVQSADLNMSTSKTRLMGFYSHSSRNKTMFINNRFQQQFFLNFIFIKESLTSRNKRSVADQLNDTFSDSNLTMAAFYNEDIINRLFQNSKPYFYYCVIGKNNFNILKLQKGTTLRLSYVGYLNSKLFTGKSANNSLSCSSRKQVSPYVIKVTPIDGLLSAPDLVYTIFGPQTVN
jgi:hypothetical protein